MSNIQLEIGDFLGFCDMNGVEAIQTEQVQQLEGYIRVCRDAANNGEELVPDAIWDRLMEILVQVNPESELCKYIWEDSVEPYTDLDEIVKKNPMYSIRTVKAYDSMEFRDFVNRLPQEEFSVNVSVKLNGHGIRLVYSGVDFICARSRARSSAGRDITKQLRYILEKKALDRIDRLRDFGLCEVRGEWLLPFENVDEAKKYNPDIKSPFSGVASMGRDSASEEEYGLLRFVAYEFLSDFKTFNSKTEEYLFLEDLGFETPLYFPVEEVTKDTFLEVIKSTVSDIEDAIVDKSENFMLYEYYTDGLVVTIDSKEVFQMMGDDGGRYRYGNIALKLGLWEQNIINSYVQAIMWKRGKSKLSPVAIVADTPNKIRFKDGLDHMYFFDKAEVDNWDALGVVTASGNRVRRVPLYEPANMIVLDAYPGRVLHFRYGGEAGVVPCFEDGLPLVDGKIRNVLIEEDNFVESGDWE